MVFSTLFLLYHGVQCTTPHNFLSKPLAAFPQNHRQNNGLRLEKNESGRNDYHQSSERTLAESGIEPATSCCQVLYATDWATGLGGTDFETTL